MTYDTQMQIEGKEILTVQQTVSLRLGITNGRSQNNREMLLMAHSLSARCESSKGRERGVVPSPACAPLAITRSPACARQHGGVGKLFTQAVPCL